MRVLLVSANTEMVNMPVLPLGMACVGAAVRDAGHDLEMINLMAREDAESALEDAIGAFDPEVVGVSVRNIDDQVSENPKFMLGPVKRIVDICKSLSGAPVVLGGAGYSIFPEKALAYLGGDIGIRGEGERTFNLLLERLEKKADFSDIPDICLKDKPSGRKTCFPKNLDQYRIPDPKDLDPPPGLRDSEIWMPFQTRRGCPFRCSYCSTPLIEGRTLRKHSPEKAAEALSRFADAGFDRFFIVDNTFNLPPSHAKKLCDSISKAGLKVSLRCILYPRNVDGELVEKMAKAGCNEVALGFESGSDEMLQRMNKNFSTADIRRISGMLGANGIGRMGFLLLGGPGETKKTVTESLDFADSLGLDTVKLTAGIRIYPGTRLREAAVAKGMIAKDDDLLFPKFYIEENIGDWIRETIAGRIAERPGWMK